MNSTEPTRESVVKAMEREGIETLDFAIQDEGEPTEPYFSWSWCELCNCSLGGNRYDCIALHTESTDILEYSVCEDCIMAYMT